MKSAATQVILMSFVLSLATPCDTLAQKATAPAKPVSTASLAGKVFAITKGGDVKPALMAHVYLFPSGRAINAYLIARLQIDAKKEAKMIEIERKSKEAGLEPYRSSAEQLQDCRDVLRGVDEAIKESMDVAPELLGPAYTAATDETGNFKITRVKRGDYQIVVRGQAGFNDVLWIEPVAVDAGKTTILKLSSVAKACQVE
jgi:hypothetical protein